MNEAPMLIPHRRVRGPAVAPTLALDLGMWLNMVNVKPLFLMIESHENDIESWNRNKNILRDGKDVKKFM